MLTLTEFLPDLPLTAHGKVDRKALPHPARTADTAAAGVRREGHVLELTDETHAAVGDEAQVFVDVVQHRRLAVQPQRVAERVVASGLGEGRGAIDVGRGPSATGKLLGEGVPRCLRHLSHPDDEAAV